MDIQDSTIYSGTQSMNHQQMTSTTTASAAGIASYSVTSGATNVVGTGAHVSNITASASSSYQRDPSHRTINTAINTGARIPAVSRGNIAAYSASYGTGMSQAVPRSEPPIKTVSHFVEKQKEVIREVPKTQVVHVEHTVEVPGEIVEVTKKVLVDTHVVIPRYIDEVVPTVIAQRMEPIVREATEEDGVFVDVKCRVVSFKPVQVDVFVPLPVSRDLVAKAKYEQHRELNPSVVPAEQYNALLKSLNADTPLEHILPLFQVTPEVAGRIARRDYQGISAVGAIPCATGPGAAFVEVPEDTPIYPNGRMGYDHPFKIFPGLWPAADGWKEAEESNKQRNINKKTPESKKPEQHRYTPYNYKFSSNDHFDPSLAEPFHVHHHIGHEVQQ